MPNFINVWPESNTGPSMQCTSCGQVVSIHQYDHVCEMPQQDDYFGMVPDTTDDEKKSARHEFNAGLTSGSF